MPGQDEPDHLEEDPVAISERELQEAEGTSGANSREVSAALLKLSAILRLRKIRLLEAANLEARARLILSNLDSAEAQTSPGEQSSESSRSFADQSDNCAPEEAGAMPDERKCLYCGGDIGLEAAVCQYCFKFNGFPDGYDWLLQAALTAVVVSIAGGISALMALPVMELFPDSPALPFVIAVVIWLFLYLFERKYPPRRSSARCGLPAQLSYCSLATAAGSSYAGAAIAPSLIVGGATTAVLTFLLGRRAAGTAALLVALASAIIHGRMTGPVIAVLTGIAAVGLLPMFCRSLAVNRKTGSGALGKSNLVPAVFSDYLNTTFSVLRNPKQFFDQIEPKWSLARPWRYFLMSAAIFSLAMAVECYQVVLAISRIDSIAGSVDSCPGLEYVAIFAVSALLFAVLYMVVMPGIAMFAFTMLGARGAVKENFEAFAYGAAVLSYAWIPVLGWLGALYFHAILYFGLQKAHKLSSGRTIAGMLLTYLVPVVVYYAVVIASLIVMFISMFFRG